jgi:hypothetical protein
MGALAARGKPPGHAKLGGRGRDTAWRPCVGTSPTSSSCGKPCSGCAQSSGMDCSGATKIPSDLSAMVHMETCRASSRTTCWSSSGRCRLPPSDVQHGEDFLSFAFLADPAQLAQVFERPVQRELVRCDFGKPILGVHWSHRHSPENILRLAPSPAKNGTGVFDNLRTCGRNRLRSAVPTSALLTWLG